MSQTIEFFWDPVSPYTYLVTGAVEDLAQATGSTLQWRPFLLGGVLQATGNSPPAANPAKSKHVNRDLRRCAALAGLGLTMPEPFPVNTVLPLRVAIGLDVDEATRARFARALMAAYWRDGRNISDPAQLGAICTNFGLDAEQALAAAQQQSVKDELRRNTDDAVARGAFGAPVFFVGDAMFWGQDRLDHMRAFLAGRLAE